MAFSLFKVLQEGHLWGGLPPGGTAGSQTSLGAEPQEFFLCFISTPMSGFPAPYLAFIPNPEGDSLKERGRI